MVADVTEIVVIATILAEEDHNLIITLKKIKFFQKLFFTKFEKYSLAFW